VLGYVALIAAERVGLPLTAYVNVRLEKHTARQAQPDGLVPCGRTNLARSRRMLGSDRRNGDRVNNTTALPV